MTDVAVGNDEYILVVGSDVVQAVVPRPLCRRFALAPEHRHHLEAGRGVSSRHRAIGAVNEDRIGLAGQSEAVSSSEGVVADHRCSAFRNAMSSRIATIESSGPLTTPFTLRFSFASNQGMFS